MTRNPFEPPTMVFVIIAIGFASVLLYVGLYALQGAF